MNNKVCIVTGASSGIGLATAELLVRNGYRVFGFSRSLVNTAGITELKVDVRDAKSVTDAVKQVQATAGRIDVLVNAAGYSISGAIEESSIEQAKALFDTNLFGVAQLCRAVLPVMRQQKSGRIINISSLLGVMPSPLMGYYGASKHALEGYTGTLDHEVRAQGIRAIVIEAGFTKTRIVQNMQRADTPVDVYKPIVQRFEAAIGKAIQTGAGPEGAAAVILSAITARNPKPCYTVGAQITLFSLLWRFMPRSLIDKALRKEFQLDKCD